MRMRLTRTSCGAALLELSAECHRERARGSGGSHTKCMCNVNVALILIIASGRECVCAVLGIVLIVLHFWGP